MTIAAALRDARAHLLNPLSEPSALLWLRGAEQAVSNRQFDTAHDRLMHAVIALKNAEIATDTKRSLAYALFEIAVLSGDASQVREATQSPARNWFTAEEKSVHRDLEKLLAHLNQFSNDVANGICDAFVHAFPAFGWPRLARGLYRERLSADPDTVLDDYISASHAFERSGATTSQTRAHVRAAVFLFREGRDKRYARQLVRSVNREHLEPRELCWLAIGWAKSTHWLDHVRGFDLLEDLMEREPRVSDAQLSSSQVETTVTTFTRDLPLVMEEGAVERFEEFVFSIPDNVSVQTEYRIRKAIMDDDPSSPALQPLRRFDLAFSGGTADGDVGRFYRGLKFDDPELSIDALTRMSKRIDHIGDLPLAAMWPDIIGFVAPRRDELEPFVSNLAIHFADRAPTPSYGWWPLAASFAEHKIRRASAACAERALREGESFEERARAQTIALCVDWAIRDGGPETMKRWLRIGHDMWG